MARPDGGWPLAAVLAACPSGPVPEKSARATRLYDVHRGRVDPTRALLVWVTDLLLSQLADKADGVWSWAFRAETGDGLRDHVAGALAGRRPPPALSVTAGRYVSFTGAKEAYDLDAAEPAGRAPEDWLETRVFNLRTLYHLCAARADAWKPTDTDATPTPRPGA